MERVPALIAKEIGRSAGPPVYNYLGRPSLVATAGLLEAGVGVGGFATASLTKSFVEHVVARPFVFYPAKVVARTAVETYGAASALTGWQPFGAVNGNSRWFPRIGWENIWEYGVRNGAAAGHGLPVRPAGLKWWRDGAGNVRVAGWSWLGLRHLPPYVRHRDRPEFPDGVTFDPNTIFKSTRPHSPLWYQRYRNWMSQQMVHTIEGVLDDILTPRINGANFVRTDGANPLASNGAEPTAANIAALIGGGPIPNGEAPIDYAAGYYKYPDLWKALTQRGNQAEIDVSNAAYKFVINQVKTLWKTKHLEQHEELKWRADLKLLKKIEHKLAWYHAYADWLKFLSGCRGGYDAENSLLRTFMGVLVR
jgi:hypothetical protein